MPLGSWRKQVAAVLARASTRLDPTAAEAAGPDAAASDAAGSGPVASGPVDELLRLLFPGGLDGQQRARVLAVIGGDDPFAAGTVRRMLGAVDQQTVWSPVVVRFGPDDLERVDVDGAVLVLDRADASVSVQIRHDGHYEPYLSAVLDGLLGTGDVFVDVGANVGYHTVRAARSVGDGGRVLAVEANPENARLLALTVAANDFEHVDVLPIALGDRAGSVHFGSHIGSNGGFAAGGLEALSSGRGTMVPSIPLDDLRLDRLDVMKIDVEGAESIVIAGALDTIARLRPAIVMEFSCEMTQRVGGITPQAHLDRIVDLGYTLHLIDRNGGPPIPVESPAALLASWGPITRLEDLLALPTDRVLNR